MARKTSKGDPERRKIAEQIFAGMRSGLSAHKACKLAGIPQGTFNGWVDEDVELAEQYTRARSELLDRLADELLDISDSDVGMLPDGKKDWAAIQKHKLQVDTRKWLLSKLAPKKYGDRIEIAGDEAAPLKVEHAIDVSKLSTDALAQIVAARKATDAK